MYNGYKNIPCDESGFGSQLALYFVSSCSSFFLFSILTPLVFNSFSLKVNFKIKGKFRKWKNIDNPVPR